jgi:hypothetical protein
MLSCLFEAGQIDLRRRALFDLAPGPMPASLNWERVEGVMLSVAIGDAQFETEEEHGEPVAFSWIVARGPASPEKRGAGARPSARLFLRALRRMLQGVRAGDRA